jgi:hypothetical protein
MTRLHREAVAADRASRRIEKIQQVPSPRIHASIDRPLFIETQADPISAIDAGSEPREFSRGCGIDDDYGRAAQRD